MARERELEKWRKEKEEILEERKTRRGHQKRPRVTETVYPTVRMRGDRIRVVYDK